MKVPAAISCSRCAGEFVVEAQNAVQGAVFSCPYCRTKSKYVGENKTRIQKVASEFQRYLKSS